VVNLTPQAIRLDAEVPHLKIMAEGRRLKTDDSAREIPLVGVALAAMKLRPEGLPVGHAQQAPAGERAAADGRPYGLFAAPQLQGPPSRGRGAGQPH
jgi:hypothetical protein